ncbi:MAG: translocation/assembly module TamB domain-containing protein [Myxococcaceae bacterium]|nr:translocation/assembly module TamB domain-containing protein [Myxococcaceae bacterium]
MSRRRFKPWRLLLVLLVLVALALGGGVAWLKSAGGQAFLRDQVVSAAKDAIAGRLSFEGVDLQDGHLVLTGLELYTPEGELVASIARVELDIDVLAAARGDYRLSRARIERPHVVLVQDERGLNVVRALAVKHPSPDTGTGEPLALTVEAVELVDGDVSYTTEGRTVRLEQLAAKGRAVVGTLPLRVESSLDLTATGTAPVKGPVTLTASTSSPRPDTLHVVADLRFADEVVKGFFDWPAVVTQVDEVRVTPALVKALTGVDALKQVVVVKGQASLQGARLGVTGGRAKASLTGAWNLDAKSVESFELIADDLDLSEWLEGGAPSSISLTATGRAPDLSLEKLTGELVAKAAWKTSRGNPLADADVSISAMGGQATVKKLRAKVPGAEVSLEGRAALSAVDLTGTLVAHDLSRLDATVFEFTGERLPALSGRGSLDVGLSGPARHPKLTARGQLEDLRVETIAARSVSLDLALPDVTKPLDADGTLVATRLALGDQTFDEVRAGVVTHGRELDLSFTTRGLGDLSLGLHGVLDADSAGLSVASLQLDTGSDRWTLDAPSRVAWGRVLRLEPAALSAGRQHLEVSGELRGKKVKATVRAIELDLARLPRVLAPASLGLAGAVSVDGAVDGSLPRPDVVAKLGVSGGAVKGVTQLDGMVDGRFVGGRAQGVMKLSSSLGGVDARFDVPVDAVLNGTSEPLSVEADLTDVSLEALQSWRAETWPATGTLTARASVKGPANDPAVSVTVRSEELTVTRTGPLQQNVVIAPAVLAVETKDSGALTAKLEAGALGAVVTSSLETPFTVAGLRQQLSDARTLETTAFTLDTTVVGFELDTLKRLGVPGVDDVTGRASVRAHVVGSVDDPKGQVTLKFERLNAPPLEELDGELELTAGEALTRLAGKGRMQGKPLYELDLFVDAPLARLEHLDELGPEHVTGHLSITPLPLARLLPKRDDEVMPTGSLSLEVDMKGTLADPKLTIDGMVQQLSFGKVPLGQARLVSRSQGRGQAVGLTLKATGASELRATGTVGVDLSVGSLRKGLSPSAIPLDLSLTSKDFDLGFLSGVTPMVRTVAGQLTLHDFKVTGLAGSPDVSGEVAWRKGKLGLASFGEYRDITLETAVTNERVEVQTFSVRAGGGGFAMDRAVAQRQPTGVWRLESSGTATRFPIVTGDQLLAIVGVKYDLAGDLSDPIVDISKLELSRVDVELPEVKRKDIQDLERPADLVLVRGGRTVAGRKKDASTVATTTVPSRTWRAVLTAPRNLWLKSSDLNLELGLSDGFRVEYATETQLFGEAHVLAGRIDVIGREFKVNRSNAGGTRSDSSVRFAGPAKQPYVNVTALHVNDREKVTVTVSVVGRGTDVALKVTSDPPMNESDIYTLLATGRRDLRRSSGASITAEQAVSVVGSLAANQLKNALLKRLPIDIVDVVSIDTGAEGLSSTRVEVGKYLSDSLYLGYTFQPGANQSRGENTHAGRLELQVSKDVCLEATAGTAPAVGADIVWSRDF